MTNYIYIDKTLVDDTPVEPVDLATVKAWIQVDFSDFDAMITSMITGARMTIENFTNLALVDYDIEIDVETTTCKDRIILPYSIAKINADSLVVKDESGVVLDSTYYKLKGNVLQMTSKTGCFNIIYSVSNDSIPEALKEAIKMEVAERFANRGENQAMRANYDSPSLGISEAAKAKAFPYQTNWL